jgi:hypothetical protein
MDLHEEISKFDTQFERLFLLTSSKFDTMPPNCFNMRDSPIFFLIFFQSQLKSSKCHVGMGPRRQGHLQSPILAWPAVRGGRRGRPRRRSMPGGTLGGGVRW